MNQFTEAQVEAINSGAREILSVAGAGAGKTAVLTERIARLLHNGSSPSEFLVLTFTRKAAGEMIGRLEKLLSPWWGANTGKLLAPMSIGTFHSVAYGWVRQYASHLGYTDRITVIEPDESELLIEQVAVDLGYAKRKGLSLTWKSGVSMDKVMTVLGLIYSDGSQIADGRETNAIIAEYWSRLYQMNAIDFGQILVGAQKLLEDPSVRPMLLERYKYLFVDEMHDSSALDLTLQNEFAKTCSVFGVHDPRQTIYSWRGARPDLIPKLYPSAKTIQLRECFRCGDEIVFSANAMISHNPEGKTCDSMIGKTGRNGLVKVFNGRSADIVDRIVAQHDENGYPYGQIAVLARNHRTLRRLADLMAERGVPHYRSGCKFDVCETPSFKAVHAFLRLQVNPRDNLAFLWLSRSLALSQECYASIRAVAAEKRISHFEAATAIMVDGLGFCDGLDETDPLSDMLDAISVANVAHPDATKWWRDNCDGMSVQSALAWYSCRDIQDDVPDGDHANLLTAHAAKGLEWPCVFVVGLNEGDWPSSQSLRKGNIDEERRLCYVAMTRASECLFIHYRADSDQAADRKISQPSRFIWEAML